MRKISPHEGYGWLPDLPDQRDKRFHEWMNEQAAKRGTPTFEQALGFGRQAKFGEHGIELPTTPAPTMLSLKAGCPPVRDQGQQGSCTGFAIAGAISFERNRQHEAYMIPSPAFIYYNEREIEGTETTDSGAQIRDGFKSINRVGVCSESRFPYDQFVYAEAPLPSAYGAALHHKTLTYLSLSQTSTEMLVCLQSGYPFVFGISVYESFESEEATKTGVIPMPRTNEQLLGGHALLAIGFDLTTRCFLFRNSWGSSWGQAGYGTIPFAYLENVNLASDFWTIRLEQ